MLDFELVVPAFNESKSLPSLVERAGKEAQLHGYTPESFQLIIVENGSTDDTCAVLQRLKASDWGPWFRVVPIAINQGYGYGLWAGLKSTCALYVAWSHADMQCDPHDAFEALQRLKSSTDNNKLLVKGTRVGRNWKDSSVSRIFELVAFLLLGTGFSEINAQPKVFHRNLLQSVKNPPSDFAFDLYAMYCAAKSGFRFETIPVFFPPRIHGASKWAANLFSRYKTILGMIRYMCFLMRTEGRL